MPGALLAAPAGRQGLCLGLGLGPQREGAACGAAAARRPGSPRSFAACQTLRGGVALVGAHGGKLGHQGKRARSSDHRQAVALEAVGALAQAGHRAAPAWDQRPPGRGRPSGDAGLACRAAGRRGR